MVWCVVTAISKSDLDTTSDKGARRAPSVLAALQYDLWMLRSRSNSSLLRSIVVRAVLTLRDLTAAFSKFSWRTLQVFLTRVSFAVDAISFRIESMVVVCADSSRSNSSMPRVEKSIGNPRARRTPHASTNTSVVQGFVISY